LAAGKCLIGAQKGVLNRILGVLGMAQEPARKIVCGIKVRQHLPLEVSVWWPFEQDQRPGGLSCETLDQTKLFPGRS
jgi:hypothetical protein